MRQFQFGPEFQRSLLRLCMLDESFCHRAMQHVDAAYFTSRSFGWIFTTMQKYYREFGQHITDMPLREFAREEPGYAVEVEAVLAIHTVPEAGYIRQQLREFVRRNIFARAHEDATKHYNEGRHEKAYDITCRAMDALRAIEFDKPDRSWLFDELPERQARRTKVSLDPTDGVYSTGIPEVDDALNGGPKRGEVHIVIAPPKVGKTIWLVNQGFVTTRVARKPVAHFNFEGSTHLIEDRYDSCFSTELYTAVKRGEIHPTLYREMQEEYQQLRRLIVIRTINTWDVTILDVAAELRELETEGFRPEVIILDYVDLMRSRSAGSGTSETQHQLDAMRDVKRLANQGYCVWTACQTQRLREGDDEREYLLKASNIADAYGKVRIADGWGSLNATREERARGECRYYLENYRDGPVGKVFRLYNQHDRMRVATRSQEERVDTTARRRKPRQTEDE